MQEPEGLGDMDAARLDAEAEFAREDTRVADTPGSPTWPVERSSGPAIPPVGLNWLTVAQRLRADADILRHEGQIVVAGEYFPAAGFYIDPATFRAQHVDVGDIALRHGYFLGDLSAREFREWFELSREWGRGGRVVVKRESAPIDGLFLDETAAQRAKSAILQGAVGAGIRLEPGPGGILLRVARSVRPGQAATLIAANGGAVVAIAGQQVETGPPTTAPSLPAAEGDSWRPGTGAASDSEAPSERIGSSDEFPPPPTG
ncbi:MAG TPA: hypothetical protein VFB58_17320 [Chloroflexota bacterium]|nr:hypothetical protein [Chloroflexota bacterium]